MNNSQISFGNTEVKIFFIDWTLENVIGEYYSTSAEVFINTNCTLNLTLYNLTERSIEARIKWNNFLKIKNVHFKVSVLDPECNVLQMIFVDSFRSVKLENGQEIITDRAVLLGPTSLVIQSIHMRCELCIHIERWNISLESFNSPSSTLQNGRHSFSILSENMKQILKEDNFADMGVKVCGKIVKLHRALLQCRCPSFLKFLEISTMDKLKSPLEDNLGAIQTRQQGYQRYFDHAEALQNDATSPQPNSHAVTANRCEGSQLNTETLIQSQENPSYEVDLILSRNRPNTEEAVKESNVSNGTLLHFFNLSTVVSNEHESIHSEENEVLFNEKCAPISENLDVDVSTNESSHCNDIKSSDINMKKMKDLRIHFPSTEHVLPPDNFQIDSSESMECLKSNENTVSQCTEDTEVSLQTKNSTKFTAILKDCKSLKVKESNVTNTSYDNPDFENIQSVSIQNSECNLYRNQSTEHLNAEPMAPSDNNKLANKYKNKYFSDNVESKIDSEDEEGSLFISCTKSHIYDAQSFPLKEGTLRKRVNSKCIESVQESHMCSPINTPNLSNNEKIKFDQHRSTMLVESTQESVPCNELESNVKLHQTSNSVYTESKQELHCLEDVDNNVFNSIINYLYSGNIEEMNCETECLFWFHVHAFANKFGLTNLCRQLAPTKIQVSTRPSVNRNYSLLWPLDNFDFSGKCTSLWSPFYELAILNKPFRWNLELSVKDFLISIQLKLVNPSLGLPTHYGQCTISITSKRKKEVINLKQKSTSWISLWEKITKDPEPLNFDFSPYLINTNSFVFDLITIQCDVEIYSCFPNSKYKVEAYISMPSANTFSDTLSRDLGSLLETGSFSDFRIQTSNKAFHAHKFILSARSPTFSQIFKARDQKEIHIQNMHDTTVEKLLQYIYTGRVTDAEKLDRDLYEAASYYKLPDLQNQWRQQIVKQLDNANACDCLVMAHSHQDEILKKLVEEYLMEHVSDVFLTDSGISFIKDQPELASGVFRQLSFAYKNQRSK